MNTALSILIAVITWGSLAGVVIALSYFVKAERQLTPQALEKLRSKWSGSSWKKPQLGEDTTPPTDRDTIHQHLAFDVRKSIRGAEIELPRDLRAGLLASDRELVPTNFGGLPQRILNSQILPVPRTNVSVDYGNQSQNIFGEPTTKRTDMIKRTVTISIFNFPKAI